MNEAGIRPASPADRAAVEDLVRRAYQPYVARLGKPPGPMLDDYASRIDAGQVWVMQRGSGIVGVLVLDRSAGGFLLDNVAVAPEAQGQGLGRELIGFAEAQARRLGASSIRLYTHVLMVENVARYRRLGFVETGRGDENGYRRVYMAKRLSPD